MVLNFPIAEVNELKNVCITVFRFTFYVFRIKKIIFFSFITLNPRGRTRLIFKINVKRKEWGRFV